MFKIKVLKLLKIKDKIEDGMKEEFSLAHEKCPQTQID